MNNIKCSITPIDGNYDFALEFHDGLAFVRNNIEEFKIGFIDKTGKVVIPLDYYGRFGREIFVNPGFFDGLAVVINADGKFGFLNMTGEIVIPFEYERALVYNDGLASVKKDGKWGFVDKNNTVVIPFEYDHLGSGTFFQGKALVQKGDKWGYIDKTGAIIVPFTLEHDEVFIEGEPIEKVESPFAKDYDEVNGFHEGFATVKIKDKYGKIDQSGNIVVPIEYDWMTAVSEGLALAQKDGKWFVIEFD